MWGVRRGTGRRAVRDVVPVDVEIAVVHQASEIVAALRSVTGE